LISINPLFAAWFIMIVEGYFAEHLARPYFAQSASDSGAA
jgi:hypothetical protein